MTMTMAIHNANISNDFWDKSRQLRDEVPAFEEMAEDKCDLTNLQLPKTSTTPSEIACSMHIQDERNTPTPSNAGAELPTSFTFAIFGAPLSNIAGWDLNEKLSYYF